MNIKHWTAVLAAVCSVTAPAEAAAEPTATPGAPPPYTDVVPVSVGVATAEPPQAETVSRNRLIEEVIVTAQKREENLQDVPISISAFSASQLDAKNITDASKLQMVTPGLIFDSTASFSVIFLRGVGTDAFLPSVDLSVATYVDGVYFPYSFNLARSFGALERVEVVKGPQGTLFGRNATGGAISIITKAPSDEFEGSFQQAFSRFDETRSKLFITGPLTDTISASGSIIYNHKNDYYQVAQESPLTNELQAYQDKGADLKIRWRPSEAFDATVSGIALETRGPSSSAFILEKPSPVLGKLLGLQPPAHDYEYSGDTPAASFSSLEATSLTMNLRLPSFDIKSISAYQDLKGNDVVDFDGTEKPVVDFRGGSEPGGGASDPPNDDPLLARVVTQELQFLSNDGGWAADKLKWVGGLYYIKSKAGFDRINVTVGALDDLLSANALGLLGSNNLIRSVQGLLSPLDPPPVGALVRLNGLLDTTSYAAFAQATYNPVEWLGITLGGRVQYEERTLYNASTAIAIQPSNQPVTLIPFDDRRREEKPFVPKVSVDAKLNDEVLLYASWQKGHKSGSYNLVNIATQPSEISAEEVTAIELGTKADFFSKRLRVNAALFQNKVDNLQVQFVSLLSGAAVTFENAGKATIRGADATVTWSITDSLVLDTGFSVLHGIYDEYVNGSGYNPQTGLYSQDNDYSGNRIVRNPKFSGNATLSQIFEVPGGDLEVSADYYYNDGYFFDAQNSTKQDAYQVFGAQLSYKYQPWDLRVTVFGENLTNEKYYIYKFPVDFGVVSKLQPPVVYGLRLNWDF